jgi:hypothetical protein
MKFTFLSYTLIFMQENYTPYIKEYMEDFFQLQSMCNSQDIFSMCNSQDNINHDTIRWSRRQLMFRLSKTKISNTHLRTHT